MNLSRAFRRKARRTGAATFSYARAGSPLLSLLLRRGTTCNQKLRGLLDIDVDGCAKVWTELEDTEIPKFRLWLHAQGQKADGRAQGGHTRAPARHARSRRLRTAHDGHYALRRGEEGRPGPWLHGEERDHVHPDMTRSYAPTPAPLARPAPPAPRHHVRPFCIHGSCCSRVCWSMLALRPMMRSWP
jgi:hypothetical protein